jgi:hypothetical protein
MKEMIILSKSLIFCIKSNLKYELSLSGIYTLINENVNHPENIRLSARTVSKGF